MVGRLDLQLQPRDAGHAHLGHEAERVSGLDALDAPPVDGVALGERARGPAAAQARRRRARGRRCRAGATGSRPSRHSRRDRRSSPRRAATARRPRAPSRTPAGRWNSFVPRCEPEPAAAAARRGRSAHPASATGARDASTLSARAHRFAVRHQRRPGSSSRIRWSWRHDVVAEPVDERPRDLHVDARHEVQPVRRELRRQDRHADQAERPVLLLRRHAEHVAVGQHRAAADVEDLAGRARLAEAADEVAHDVADRDRLAPRRHPLRRHHRGQAPRQVAHDLERRRARSDDHGGAQLGHRHAGLAQRVAGRLAAREVLRQLVALAAEARQVDDPRRRRRPRTPARSASPRRCRARGSRSPRRASGRDSTRRRRRPAASCSDSRSSTSPPTAENCGSDANTRPASLPGVRASPRTSWPASSSAGIRRPPM